MAHHRRYPKIRTAAVKPVCGCDGFCCWPTSMTSTMSFGIPEVPSELRVTRDHDQNVITVERVYNLSAPNDTLQVSMSLVSEDPMMPQLGAPFPRRDGQT